MSSFPNLSSGNVTVRPMREDEYGLYARWRNQPHVRQWWDPDDPPMTAETAEHECAAAVRGAGPDRAAIVELGGEPVGFIQFYPWDAYADELHECGLDLPAGSWGLDIFIGVESAQGRGVGSTAVRLVADHVMAAEAATAVAFGVAVGNDHAQRAYERAGFVAGQEYRDTDTRDGERVRCRLMRLDP